MFSYREWMIQERVFHGCVKSSSFTNLITLHKITYVTVYFSDMRFLYVTLYMNTSFLKQYAIYKCRKIAYFLWRSEDPGSGMALLVGENIIYEIMIAKCKKELIAYNILENVLLFSSKIFICFLTYFLVHQFVTRI